MARFDIARGHYSVLSYGLAASWVPEYRTLLHDRYGISHKTIAGCTISYPRMAYADAYNRVSVPAANQRFGHDVFKECSDGARKRWYESHKAEMEKVKADLQKIGRRE